MKVKLFRNAYSRNAAFNWMVVLCLLVYAAVMLYLLYFRQRYLMWGYSYNLVPFKTIQSYINSIGRMNSDIWIKNLFGNIILFIPIGVFMPLLNKKLRASIPVITWCALLILIVELVQLLTKRGSFDVDDIILNTLGAWIGLMLVRPFLKKI
ncbi:hypothetical protein A7K91_06775 [Paenibacillus oryzae]|uniref:VanZ-like domain-containing protein n=1 Tax=Paenibacillus oryzae TaxID=1844972 RepID=A0A1A5YE15_9BACL|nr:VanZ family protein [Paenibacillus oryzae]OBR63640.1 hypothetical protein A7K91_06775 [Paenibacillus oryzae]